MTDDQAQPAPPTEREEREDGWVPSALLHMAQAVEDGEGPPCLCDGDNVALQVLCRAFDEDPSDLIKEWRAYDKSGWFWWGRALGGFMREKIKALRTHSPSEPPTLVHDGHCVTCGAPAEIVESDEGTHSVVHSPEEPVGWRPMEEAPRDGSDIVVYMRADRRSGSEEHFFRLRWSTHYSIHGLGGCWTDGICTMSDLDFDGWVPAPIGQPLDSGET